jgi:predicted nucleic acid-binding protein
MAERVLIDTGPIIAVLSADDEHHNRCSQAWDQGTWIAGHHT